MSKFKIGDKVRCIKSYRDHITIGCTYEVLDVTGGMYLHVDTGDRIIGVGGYAADRFELVPEYLTPEQVLKYFKGGRQDELECSSKVKASGWAEMLPNEDMYVSQINERKWRVKPVPKTIDYYGTELPKPITKAEAKELGLNAVYKLMLGLGDNLVKRITNLDHDIGDNLYFKTVEDALLVREAMLKPFKQ